MITNVATGVTRNVTTDSAGFYTAPNLLPGTYEIRTMATVLSTAVQKGINAQFRMEVFNILNDANFATPSLANSQIFDSTGGLIPTAGFLTAPTTTMARQMQFALKVTW